MDKVLRCRAGAVSNSESLRGLDDCIARVVRNSASRYVDKGIALLGQSVTASRYVDCIAGASWSVDRLSRF